MNTPLQRLIKILEEKILEEKNGMESYDNIINYVVTLKLPRHIERDILEYLYKIHSDEEIHVDVLTIIKDKLVKTFK